jgi:hypothetical protein
MVLISIDPFTHRKILLIAVALLGLSACCFADPVLMTQRYSPTSGRLDTSGTKVTAGQQSEPQGKARMVDSEMRKCELSQRMRDAEWKSTELWANLGLQPVDPPSGFSPRTIGVRLELVD